MRDEIGMNMFKYALKIQCDNIYINPDKIHLNITIES